MSDMRERVVVTEVGMRDGLQSIAQTMPTESKRRWIDAAYAAGVRHMEVASLCRRSCCRKWPTPTRSSPTRWVMAI